MEFNEVWLAYVNQRITEEMASRASLEFRAWGTLERFFEFHPMLTARWNAIAATSFNTDFDEIADRALVQVAATDSFASWDEHLPAGGWRVISDRLLYSQIVLCVMATKEPKAIMDGLPRGLTRDQENNALLLKYLLGHGRSIDRRVLPIRHDLSLGSFPRSQTLRRQ